MYNSRMETMKKNRITLRPGVDLTITYAVENLLDSKEETKIGSLHVKPLKGTCEIEYEINRDGPYEVNLELMENADGVCAELCDIAGDNNGVISIDEIKRYFKKQKFITRLQGV